MSSNVISNYFVTISPNPRATVRSRSYAACEETEQMCAIWDATNNALKWCEAETFPILHFEFNKRLQIHCHATFKLSVRNMAKVQRKINARLGSLKNNPDICCNVCPEELWKPKINKITGEPFESWDEYCLKDNGNVLTVRCNCVKCKVYREDRMMTYLEETGQIGTPYFKKGETE